MTATIFYHLAMLGAALDLVLLVGIARRRPAEGIGVFRLMLAAVILWIVGLANARVAFSPELRLAWTWVEFLGRPVAPALWLLFALRYTRTWRRASIAWLTALFTIPALTVLMAWTNGLHGLVWSPEVADPLGMAANAVAGPWFRWVQLPFSWLASAGGCLLILMRGRRSTARASLHPWLFLAVGVPPLAVSVAAALSEQVRAWPELVPLAFIVGAGPLLYGLARNPLFGLSLPTYRTIFESIGDAVLVIDGDARIIDVNRAAETSFGRSRRLALGMPVAELLPSWSDLAARLGDRGELHQDIQVESKEGPRTLEVHIFVLRDAGSPAKQLVLVRDISSRRAYERQIEHLAYHDPLTGLPNRRWLETAGDRLLSLAGREQREAAVLFIDLDDFKDVNDTLGHAAGDELLLEVAARFRATSRAESVLVRLGGDEFAVMLSECDGASARAAGARLLEVLGSPFQLAGAEVYAGASVGIALFPRHGTSMEDLLRRADVAMYAAKRSRGGIELYDPETDPYTHERLRLQSELYRALQESNQLLVYYQPIFDTSVRRVVAVEALVRWQHPDRGFLEPASFLPVAESSRLITQLDRYVLRRALQDWRGTEIEVAVNVHPRTLMDREYAEAVAAELAASGFPAGRLMLEITEHALADPDGMRAALAELSSLGVVLMADDYGTGQSSLIYIRKFPFDGLKIDRSLAAGIGLRREDEAIVEAVAGLARRLDLRLVVEGVEASEAVDWLTARNCHTIQGWAVCRARPLEELLERYPELGRRRHLVAVAG
jgi:diguanylate cyclase (GGDEF)-like protein/PAS domain S-box-containing protein